MAKVLLLILTLALVSMAAADADPLYQASVLMQTPLGKLTIDFKEIGTIKMPENCDAANVRSKGEACDAA
jgi:hypothetical protein